MRGLVIGCAICWMFIGNAVADSVQQGYEAYQRKDWTAAYDLWRPEAEAGNVRAQFYLSVLYAEGIGVAFSPDLAKHWLLKAAEGGFPAAQFNLGNWYQQGTWVEMDDSQSAYWWEKAAQQGFSKAQFNLASLYYLGRGVDQSQAQAIHWYTQAAHGGSKKAKEMLTKLGQPYVPKATPVGLVLPGEVVGAVSVKLENPHQKLEVDVSKNNKLSAKPPAENSTEKTLKTGQNVPFFQGGEWIMMQPDGNYTIQVFATDNRESALELQKSLKVSGQSATFSYSRFGQQWYAVVTGSYATLGEAKRVVNALPESVKRERPWIKRFRVIKEAMERNN